MFCFNRRKSQDTQYKTPTIDTVFLLKTTLIRWFVHIFLLAGVIENPSSRLTHLHFSFESFLEFSIFITIVTTILVGSLLGVCFFICGNLIRSWPIHVGSRSCVLHTCFRAHKHTLSHTHKTYFPVFSEINLKIK